MNMIEASPCDHRRMLGCARYNSPKERDWYEQHEPWLWEQLENGTTRWADEPAFIVDSALGWLFERAEGAEPRWEDLDVKELLLEDLPLGGLPANFGSGDLLLGLEEFLAWMGQRGKLNPAAAARLMGEVDTCREPFLDHFGDTESVEQEERLEVKLSSLAEPGDAWLCCLHCNRFFQAKDLRMDFTSNRQGCAFVECGAAGFDVDIHPWDAFRNNRDTRWPASTEDLHHGMLVPK